MGQQSACQKEGTHACRDVASHRDACGWMAPVGYAAHVSDRPSPSALPPRRGAVVAHLARFRVLPINKLCPEADSLIAGLWREFTKRWRAAMAAAPLGARQDSGQASP